MKKHFLIIVFICIFFFSPIIAIADFGELNYNIEDVTLSNEYIIIKGWAFIHQTNNYAKIYELNANGIPTNKLIKDDGGQKVFIKVKNEDESKIKEYTYTAKNDNYNFYYQHYAWDDYYSVDTYNNIDMNTCGSRCYYEDLGFTIKIPINEIINIFSSGEKITFYISATNNHLISKGKERTEEEKLKVIHINGKSDYIELTSGTPNGEVKLIAEDARFQKLYEQQKYCTNNLDTCTNDYAIWGITNKKYNIMNYNENDYINGFYAEPKNGSPMGYDFLKDTYSPGKFVICVFNDGNNACSSTNKNNYCNNCDGVKVAAYGSWIKFEGTNELSFKTKNDKKCDPVTPATGNLECNNSKTYNSTCKELTVNTAEGSANVKIEQTGIVSSILTPDKIYEGGGFNLGILYTNAIKWSYVGNKPNNELHNAINKIMRDKLYDYESYISGLNIANLKLGGETKDSSFLIKECKTSDENNNYYDKELTVSCVFHFPKSEIKQNGNVNYTTGDSGLGISNKYYTSLGNSGNYKITADIVGMNRIKDTSAKNDSSKKNIAWTGIWEDSFTNCEIDVYSLYSISKDSIEDEDYDYNYSGNKKIIYNFIYRPIDISNPFPNRNAGINWFEWWSIQKNRNDLKDTYKNEPQYSIVLDNQKISEIKKDNSNSTNGYFDWDTLKNGESTFVNEYFNTKRVGVE